MRDNIPNFWPRLHAIVQGSIKTDLTVAEYFGFEDSDLQVEFAEYIQNNEKPNRDVSNNSGITCNSSGSFIPYIIIDGLAKNLSHKDVETLWQEIAGTAFHELLHTRLPANFASNENLVLGLEGQIFWLEILEVPNIYSFFGGFYHFPIIDLEEEVDENEEL